MTLKPLNELIIDDCDGFKVHRSIYTDEEIFQLEMKHIFEKSWVYVAHESQIKNHGDYFSTFIGRQPIFVVRLSNGSIAAHLNACSHRASTLVPLEGGNLKAIRCRFHGWTFNLNGQCLVIKNEDSGHYASDQLKRESALTSLPKLQSYRGFIFASLSSEVPPLEEWLCGTKDWIDCMVDQSPKGLEIVKGSSTYVLHGNWKLQAENGVDGYHVSTVHRVFATTIANRESKTQLKALGQTEAGRITGDVPSGSYDFGNGHMGIWTERSKPQAHPLWLEKERIDREFSAAKAKWMLFRTRNLFMFPNAFLMDNPSTQIRTMRPLSANVCDVTVRCIAPVGESVQARSARLRKFEDFYLTTGMATSDDLAALESVQEGGRASNSPWNHFARGQNAIVPKGNGELLMSSNPPQFTTQNWDHEILYHGFYRTWKSLIQKGLHHEPPF
jgi:benzoate/toluate 1,2-dioxygenase alpha subunit